MIDNIKNWYKRHGLPDPEDGDAVMEARIKQEAKRVYDRDTGLWNQITKNVKPEQVFQQEEIIPSKDAINVSNPEDVIIRFK